jgi:hypothetical protein
MLVHCKIKSFLVLLMLAADSELPQSCFFYFWERNTLICISSTTTQVLQLKDASGMYALETFYCLSAHMMALATRLHRAPERHYTCAAAIHIL